MVNVSIRLTMSYVSFWYTLMCSGNIKLLETESKYTEFRNIT